MSIPSSDEVRRLLGGDKAQRADAWAELEALARGPATGERVAVAVECVVPLMEAGFAADTSVVDAAEYRRACLCLAELHALDPLRVAAEAWREDRAIRLAMGSPSNAYKQVFEKEAADLTRDDALTVACATAPYALYFSRGPDPVCAAADLQFMTVVTGMQELNLQTPGHPTTDAFIERLGLLMLDLVRDAHQSETPELALAGDVMALAWCLSARPKVGAALVAAGFVEVVVAALRRSAPVEWLSWK